MEVTAGANNYMVSFIDEKTGAAKYSPHDENIRHHRGVQLAQEELDNGSTVLKLHRDPGGA